MAPSAGSRSEDGARNGLPLAVRQRLQQLFQRGQACLEKGDHDYAHDLFSQCVSEDPGSLVYAQHFRANLTKKFGEGKRSGVFSAFAKSGKTQIAKLAAKGNWPEAFAAGCQALKKNPADLAALREMAAACGALHHADCQLFYFRWALDLDGEDVETNQQAAEALASVGQFEQAIACWQRVLQKKPGDVPAQKAISRLSVESTIARGGYDPALLQGAGQAAELSTARVADLSLGDSASHVIPADESAKDSSKPSPRQEQSLLDAINADPSSTSNYVELAEIYIGQERLQEAERLLMKALQASGGGDLGIRESLEDLQLRRIRGQVDAARKRAQEEATPESNDLAQRMIAHANEQELEVYAARVERQPANPRLQFELGLRFKRLGKHRQAIQAFQAARDETRRAAETQLLLGECFQQIKQYKLALGAYEASVAAQEHGTEEIGKLALYRAGVLAMGLKDLDRAEKWFAELAARDFAYRDIADRLDKIAAMRNAT